MRASCSLTSFHRCKSVNSSSCLDPSTQTQTLQMRTASLSRFAEAKSTPAFHTHLAISFASHPHSLTTSQPSLPPSQLVQAKPNLFILLSSFPHQSQKNLNPPLPASLPFLPHSRSRPCHTAHPNIPDTDRVRLLFRDKRAGAGAGAGRVVTWMGWGRMRRERFTGGDEARRGGV